MEIQSQPNILLYRKVYQRAHEEGTVCPSIAELHKKVRVDTLLEAHAFCSIRFEFPRTSGEVRVP